MNLLPITEKESLKKGFKLRSVILASLILVCVFVLGIAMLLPSYFLAMGNLSKDSSGYTSGMENSTSTKELLVLPQEIDMKVKQLQASNSNVFVSDCFAKIIKPLPLGVRLDSISFSRGQSYKEKTGVIVLVSGVATDRDSLVSYVTLLKENSSFSNVDMPVSSLAKNKNLPFSINIFIEN
jgi:Tfp pilus assembly protein PilN